VRPGKKKEYFIVPPQNFKIFKDLEKKISPFFLGLPLGSSINNQFKLNIAVLDIISKFSKKTIIVTGKGEQTALYGRNIPKKFLKKVNFPAKKSDYAIITNKEKEAVAIGKFLINSEETPKFEPNQIIIKVLSDLGWYIREGK